MRREYQGRCIGRAIHLILLEPVTCGKPANGPPRATTDCEIQPWVLDAAGRRAVIREEWFRDLDSNQDTQLQRLMSYRLDDPGTAEKSLAERFRFAQTQAGECLETG